MNSPGAPLVTGGRGAVSTADHLATAAAVNVLATGGNAVDAAVCANAVMAVVGPHLCGVGGDLFALVRTPDGVFALNASGRAGSGADPAAMRASCITSMRFRHDVRSVTVPGCVDGWLGLHTRFGSMAFADVLAPAIEYAEKGFRVSPLLNAAVGRLDTSAFANLAAITSQQTAIDAFITLPRLARTLRAIVAGGRSEFYEGEFARGLIELGRGLFVASDLAASHANWVTPLSTEAFGVELHTMPPNSQGYLALGAARLAHSVGLPDNPDDPRFAHLLVECATAAGFDRPDALHEKASGPALLDEIDDRLGLINREHASDRFSPGLEGDTTYLCTADSSGMAVSLIQSNAGGFGSWLAEPNTGINLHNRGIGFNLQPGHPAEFGPRRRPPHTLCPAVATRDTELVAVFGTMGGDAQPQILLQLAARMFHYGQDPATAINAARWALEGPATGFDTWTDPQGPNLALEGHVPATWSSDLAQRGHRIVNRQAFDSAFGHAAAIAVRPDGGFEGAADPRTIVGSCGAI